MDGVGAALALPVGEYDPGARAHTHNGRAGAVMGTAVSARVPQRQVQSSVTQNHARARGGSAHTVETVTRAMHANNYSRDAAESWLGGHRHRHRHESKKLSRANCKGRAICSSRMRKEYCAAVA